MKKIIFLACGMFVLGLDAYVIAGLLPMMHESLHVSTAALGQTVTVFTLCYALSAPIFSTLLAKKSVKYILMGAMVLFCLANVATALSTSLPSLIISRAIAGIGAGLFSPMAAAMSTSLVDEKKKGKALGLMLLGMSCGTVIGVPTGLLIAGYLSWHSVFWIISFISVLVLLGLQIFIPLTKSKTVPSLQSRVRLLQNNGIRNTVWVTFLISIASLGLYTYIAVIIKNTNAPLHLPIYLWMWGVGGISGSLMIGFLLDRVKNARVILLGIVLMLILALALLPTVLPLAVAGLIPFFIWGAMGWSSQAPQQLSLLNLKPEHGPIAIALNSSANYLGSSVGAALAGILLWYGVLPNFLPYLAAGVLVAALLFHLRLMKRWCNLPCVQLTTLKKDAKNEA